MRSKGTGGEVWAGERANTERDGGDVEIYRDEWKRLRERKLCCAVLDEKRDGGEEQRKKNGKKRVNLSLHTSKGKQLIGRLTVMAWSSEVLKSDGKLCR